MNENLYELFDDIVLSEFNIIEEGNKKIIEIGNDSEYGTMETYSIFPGIILAHMDLHVEKIDEVFVEETLNRRLLEINHCSCGRYAYAVGGNKIIYFGKGDLSVSIYDLTKSLSDFPLGYYKGLEIFIDVDVANEYIKEYIPDFDLIEFYEALKSDEGYVLIRANEKIEHVIGELYDVDKRIKDTYFKIKCIELLLFFSISDFSNEESISLSKNQVQIVENVKKDLISDLECRITIEQLASKYNISQTTLKNSFKIVFGKPIFKWRKEYKLDYACKLIREGDFTISEISKKIGYSSPSKFTQAFKEYIGCTPSQYSKY